jgi:hypothetical protein
MAFRGQTAIWHMSEESPPSSEATGDFFSIWTVIDDTSTGSSDILPILNNTITDIINNTLIMMNSTNITLPTNDGVTNATVDITSSAAMNTMMNITNNATSTTEVYIPPWMPQFILDWTNGNVLVGGILAGALMELVNIVMGSLLIGGRLAYLVGYYRISVRHRYIVRLLYYYHMFVNGSYHVLMYIQRTSCIRLQLKWLQYIIYYGNRCYHACCCYRRHNSSSSSLSSQQVNKLSHIASITLAAWYVLYHLTTLLQ